MSFKFEPTIYLNGKQVQRVKREPCKDCASDFWFDAGNSWVCSVCSKTHSKSGSETQGDKNATDR